MHFDLSFKVNIDCKMMKIQAGDVLCCLPVVLPPEKPEGCESYLQYLRSAEGEREVLLRDTSKAPGKKRISLNVSNHQRVYVDNTLHPLNIHILILKIIL